MSAFSARRLTPQDIPAIERLYRQTESWMHAPVSRKFIEKNLKTAKENYLSESDTSNVLIGVFKGDDLVLSSGIFFWDYMPFCTILRLVGKSNAVAGRQLLITFNLLYARLMDYVEARGCTRFYIISSAQHFRTLARSGRANDRLAKDYLMTIEAIIPANTRPPHEYVWKAMGDTTWPVTLVLRAGTLLNHKRKFDPALIDEETTRIFT